MDEIKFSLGIYYEENTGFNFWTIDISINDHKLLDIVSEIERENARRMGLDFWGGYASLEANPYHLQGNYFLGNNSIGQSKPTVWVLGCTCTFPECWGVQASIRANSEIVQWTDIANPWLVNGLPSVWDTVSPEDFVAFDYSSIGPFVFDRLKYDHALTVLRRSFW